MLKLIKMDFYRLFSSKAIKVGLIVAAAVSALYMLLSLGLVEIIRIIIRDDPMGVDGMSVFLPHIAWVNKIDFFGIVLNGVSAFSLFIGCMITANFIGTEQSCGYTKNFAGQLPNRGYMAISKFLVTSVAQLLVLVVYTIVSSVCTLLLLSKCISGYNELGGFLEALGLKALMYLAINAIIVFICTLSRSHAVGMVVGSIFGIGVTKLIYPILGSLLSSIKINFNIGDYMPDGVDGMLSNTIPGDLLLRGVLVGVGFIVAFVAANYFVVKIRDVK